jgi:hypothetical protein
MGKSEEDANRKEREETEVEQVKGDSKDPRGWQGRGQGQ